MYEMHRGTVARAVLLTLHPLAAWLYTILIYVELMCNNCANGGLGSNCLWSEKEQRFTGLDGK